jgi:XTP/dITP diphosphohydrolase
MELFKGIVLKKRIIFATKNVNKIEEAQLILGHDYEIKGIEITQDIPETGTTFEANALQKLQFCLSKYGDPIFSEDSGLMVEKLNGAPGVYSARYDDKGNHLDKLLKNLEGESNRKAAFFACIALYINNDFHIFTGECTGKIAMQKEGVGGFGYDPIFIPDGYDQSFATLGSGIKNKISHRRMALEKMKLFLNER